MVNLNVLAESLSSDFEYYNIVLLKKEEAIDIIIYICKTCLDYMLENILELSYQDIPKDIYTNIYELYQIQLEDIWESYSLDNDKEKTLDNLNNDIFNCILISNNIIQRFYIPVRSYKKSFIRVSQSNVKKNQIENKIKFLKSIPQPDQRTEEWYKFRHTTLTASSIWKVFYSESSQNQLIYEKCKPLVLHSSNYTNIETPFHWGQKYEPLSVLYYEYVYGTKVDDFGCIPHGTYPYIAASPDGINCYRDSERYGRMLEIKNIVNRDITGIPKMEYWIQMQIQMETCDLNECDFLETRFIEYDSKDDFINDKHFDNNNTVGINDNNIRTYRGCILHFEGETGPIYEYHEFGLTVEEIYKWEQNTMLRYPECSWVQTLYWKLSEISCILVLRNKLWFKFAQPYIELLWNIIEKEKNEDYSHRAPKKRAKIEKSKSDVFDNCDNDTTISKCLLKLD